MVFPDIETLTGLLAAWMLLVLASLWAHREKLGLSRRMFVASVRGLVQLLALASILQYIFDIQHVAVKISIIILLCLIAARVSAGHFNQVRQAWMAATVGLIVASIFSLPWLVMTGTISAKTSSLIPLASMVIANAMNAVSLMLDRINSGQNYVSGIQGALIPPVDSLRVVGLVHMPGIFVGMLLAGANPVTAASAQLVVLYMIVASTFSACIASWHMLNWLQHRRLCA